MVAGSLSTPLPPSVEEAYRRKCIDLKKRTAEVEESNDAARVRKIRLNRGIRKMRLERAYLLEMLGKRMKKNGAGVDGMPASFDDDSEGSSDGPPTPHDRPLRSKRSHRRPQGSPPPAMEYSVSQQQQGYSIGPYDQPSHHQHQSPYPPPSHSSAPNGLPPSAQYAQAQHRTMQQPPVLHSNGTVPPPYHSHAHNPMLTPIPAPDPFSMFFENNYLSQPHKHSGHRTEEDLLILAREHWNAPEYANQRRIFENQAAKQQAVYDESRLQYEMAARQHAAQAQGRSIQPKLEGEAGETRPASSRGRDIAKDEIAGEQTAERGEGDVEMRDAAVTGAHGGFTSINR